MVATAVHLRIGTVKNKLVKSMLFAAGIVPGLAAASMPGIPMAGGTGLTPFYVTGFQLGPWQEMLALGLTTTPENPPPSRTDSHAWAAHPNHGLLATVLGIRPGEPGFKSVVIAPHLGRLQTAVGRMPHPNGMIEVKLTRIGEGTGEDELEARVTLPDGLEGVFEWQGRRVAVRPGTQVLELSRADR